MNICQLYQIYGEQDTQKYYISQLICHQKQITLNQTSIMFFVHHFLDQFDYQKQNIINDQDSNVSNDGYSTILRDLDVNSSRDSNTILDSIYNSTKYQQDIIKYTQFLVSYIKHLQSAEITLNPEQQYVYDQITKELQLLDPENKLQLDVQVLKHFSVNIQSKLQYFGKPLFNQYFIQQLILLKKQLGFAFKDLQYNYAYVDSLFFSSQFKSLQIQNNLKLREKQNYSTYIFCPKCKQKKCISLGERQTTLGGDEMSRVVYQCKNTECSHKFKI